MPREKSPPSAPPPSAPPPPASARWLRRMSHTLDDSIPIPGTGYRIGIDPILGLVPGLGDIVAGVLSTLVLMEAVRRRLPRLTQLRMALNILVEVVLGAIPFVGDVFDAVWKANLRNTALLERHLLAPAAERRSNRLFGLLLVVGVLAVILGVAAAVYLLARALLG